jgi:hypothetical protein
MQLPRATRLVVRIAGKRMYLWRAVDHEGEVLDMLVQRRRDTRAALRLMRKLLKKQGCPPKLRHRPATLLRVGVPAIRAELPSRTGGQAQQSSQELSSAGATARAQGAAIQVASVRAALPEYACRRLQYLQSSTPSRPPGPRCENSAPMLPRNGKALSQPHDAWPVLALDACLLRCRDNARVS